MSPLFVLLHGGNAAIVSTFVLLVDGNDPMPASAELGNAEGKARKRP
jgi:hypothetical protein